MSIVNDQETQDFIEILYERSGRTNGLYAGLYQEWSRAVLKHAKRIELESHFVPGRGYRSLLGTSILWPGCVISQSLYNARKESADEPGLVPSVLYGGHA